MSLAVGYCGGVPGGLSDLAVDHWLMLLWLAGRCSARLRSGALGP